ncbi:rhodanese-like domain-containing protein [Corynebacterium rhinophilum]|uniref:rhodanese-like domain-containing protein n=1 Tax=Corynebacterium rhinophilum TaxID=3050197 RepID=UPI00254EAB80|nr:rhodanese-like domain-containing protein [Corynebacterium sp. MSK156]MDK8786335.1 rhodanese-like domain-containing protein [Corynebacterium sp. MSK156]
MKNVQPTEVPAGAQLIDVRENDEWATVHAQGATHIPMSEITGHIQEIDPDRDIYVICHLGGRSAQVCQYLENSLGWDVINVEGGTNQWEADGLPVVRD